MKSLLKKSDLLRAFLVMIALACLAPIMRADSIPASSSTSLSWRVGVEVSPARVPGSSYFLRGENSESKRIGQSLSGAIRADFGYNGNSLKGRLYPGLYQGLALDFRTFFASSLLGTPVSAYVYQGAPVIRFGSRLSLDYEWRFGAAFGWKHYGQGGDMDNTVVSTAVTAHMGIALRLRYRLDDRWQLAVGAEATHFSNANTSLPNAGVNSIGASVGVAYCLTPAATPPATGRHDPKPEQLKTSRWIYDIVTYGGWRKRIVNVDGDPTLCPGSFGVAGLQFSPMRQFNQWVAAGLSLDMQYDESAGLAPYAVEGTYGEDIRFYRPPFGKQLGIGLAAHGELITPLFAVNVGLGLNMLCPRDDKRFYQSLTLKAFVTRSLFLNVGYRLGDFKEPQNIMLGLGIRL